MNMKYLLLILFASFSLISSAQTFNTLIQNGKTFYAEGKFEESGKEFEKALKIQEASAIIYYDAACSWTLAGNTDKGLYYLNLAADKGWMNLKHLKSDADLQALHELKAWPNVLTKVQANLDNFEKDFDKPLKMKLEAIYTKDQTLRQLIRDAEEKFGKESEEMEYFWRLISQQDSLNEIELIQIIEKHGWLGKSVVGGKANMAIWLVIQHAALPIQEKYLPLLRESVKIGESQGNHLALLEDRIEMYNGRPQIYGSQYHFDAEKNKNVFHEIKDIETVNERRIAVKLGPIEEYAQKLQIEWPMTD